MRSLRRFQPSFTTALLLLFIFYLLRADFFAATDGDALQVEEVVVVPVPSVIPETMPAKQRIVIVTMITKEYSFTQLSLKNKHGQSLPSRLSTTLVLHQSTARDS
jgi:hypothetical protein